MAIVYQHRRKDNNMVFYVGIGKCEKRAYSKDRSLLWKKYTKKHSYYVEITHNNVCWEEACCIEKYLIHFYGRKDLGLGSLINLTDGGEGTENVIVTDDKKIKLSIIKKQQSHIYKTKEFRDTMSIVTNGANNPMYGKKHSESSIEKMKNSWDEIRKNYYKEINTGSKNPMYGKANEARSNMNKLQKGDKNPRARSVLQYDVNGNFIKEYTTIKEANKAVGSSKVGDVCRGKRKQAGGFIFKYKTK